MVPDERDARISRWPTDALVPVVRGLLPQIREKLPNGLATLFRRSMAGFAAIGGRPYVGKRRPAGVSHLARGAVGAGHLLRDRCNASARLMFSMAMWMAALVTPG
jgi:hypothetical protein